MNGENPIGYEILCYLILFALLFTIAPQLPGIERVLPDNVSTGSNGCQRNVEYGCSKPYTYDGVLLTECLSGRNGIVILAAYSLSCEEKEQSKYCRKYNHHEQSIV